MMMMTYMLSAGFQEILGSLVAWAMTLVEGAYARAPILWLALSALLVLPAVALISLAVEAGRQRRRRHAARRAAERSPEPGNLMEDAPAAAHLHAAGMVDPRRAG
jgi:hypothetical protein